MIGSVPSWVTDLGVVAAVLVAVIGAVKSIIVPLRDGLRLLEQIKDELTFNGGTSTKDIVRKIHVTVGEIQDEQASVRARLDKLEAG